MNRQVPRPLAPSRMLNHLHISLTPFRNESRVLKETESLVRAGLARCVSVVALHEDGLPEHEQIDAQRSVWRIQLRSRTWSRNLVVQAFKYLEFCARALLFARRAHVGIVSVHNVSLLPLGAALKWVCGAKLVYDTHELETETFGLHGARQRLAQWVERAFIRRAALVIVVGDAIGQWYRDAYGIDNVATVMNCPPFRAPATSGRLREAVGIPADRKIVLYQGGLIRGRGVEELLAIFADHDDGRHVLVCMGYGELESLVREHAAAHTNIFLQPAVPPEVVLEYTASADVGISYIDNGSVNDRLCLPNKLFEYVAGTLPVIVYDAPEMGRVVRQHQIGVALSELTAATLSRALIDLASITPEPVTTNLHNAAKIFSWENQAEVMVQAYRRRVIGDASIA